MRANNSLDLAVLAPFGIFAVSATALINAYIAQYVFDLEPCILCLYQRIPYAVAGVLGGVAMFVPGVRLWAVRLAGLAFLVGAGIAFYHVGVEQHWWASAASCGSAGGGDGPATVEELRQLLLNAKPVKACDEVDWTLFGLSMATYNVGLSLALGVGSLWAAGRIGGRDEQAKEQAKEKAPKNH
ncbi:MAG: disulfide bond formation protein B [Alphaproteobacteria bacterium]|jgi:disulfide bond formation protein DsbB|nr:disulfide bond formation protein B [Alphaproteobacteria bacterium]